MSGRCREQQGAVAVIFAICALMMLSVAAIGVDLGNAFVRKRDTQGQADFAALAAAASLPAPVSLTPAASDEAVKAAAQYLEKNQPRNDDGVYRTAAQLANDLVDATVANGQLYYGTFSPTGAFTASPYAVTVRTPPAFVKFGLASVMGFTDATVRASATAGMGTAGGSAEMPFFAVSGGCDYGSRLLSQPPPGRFDTVTPPYPLAKPLTDGANDNQSMTLTGLPTPPVIAIGATGAAATISIDGSKLPSVSRIAFLRGTADSPNVYEVSSGFTSNNNKISNITLPPAMTSQSAVWWVRVYKPATSSGTAQERKDGWSREYLSNGTKNMVPVQIGEDVFSCDGASEGNFGTLKLPRTDVASSRWIAKNIAKGLEPPLTLAVLPGSSATQPYCTPGAPNVVYSTVTGTPTLRARTNCVDTDTGLTSQTATDGLITGLSGDFPGRLNTDTTTGVLTSAGRNGNCGPNMTSGRRAAFGGYNINNDVLSCFMTNASTPLSTIASAAYSGGQALDPSIYASPRFCYVPVIGIKPVQGGSNTYGITDVRPCFITGEALTSTYTTQSMLDGSANGVIFTNNKVTSLRVVFFNSKALPANGPLGDYIGTGPKAVGLID